jgi:glutamate 5-kinase
VRQALERLLAWGLVPVINENDTTSTDEITFGDNDFLAALVAALLNARLLVLLTNTDGVFTADPRTSPDAELVGRIDDAEALARIDIGESSRLGRGGMQSKIASARIASESGVPVVICNGTRAGELAAAAADGEVGTRFRARVEGRLSPYKLWLKYAKRPTGEVRVDRGAAERLRGSGSSLLAVGVVAGSGAFKAGDAVWVVGEGDDEPLGKGISEYSSTDVARSAGRNSAYLREHFPEAPDEVIHRDRFVLL